ncbi:sugar O-acetyltransferase [Rarobacter faecitabidus]|uniref:Maltose O-acetyltransferase n=1 Tax=Rarobacter faecitabidus TaxID=13243 RepID=A0A542ZV54_RARFA|nr:sugar O-acetyltransferase [Rarobacter faecitabidus]TQL64245.1 maltose O-acetyltransferase [Rarobacter faecitabidus]
MDEMSRDNRSNLERLLAGETYRGGDPEVDVRILRAARLAEAYVEAWLADPAASVATLRELLGHVGDGVVVRPPITVDLGERITVGDGTFINFGLMALDIAPITIGKACQIGPNVQLLTPVHPIEPEPRRAGYESAAPITLHDNVWLGGGVIVCPGVTIGENSVVGAGSVVTRDIPANVVAVGNPARVIRSI